MPRVETLSGRALSAWWRAYAARTIWVARYARAASWPARFPGLDLSTWNSAPFGTALAALLGLPEPGRRQPAARPSRTRRAGSAPPSPRQAATPVPHAGAAKRPVTGARAAIARHQRATSVPLATLRRLAGGPVPQLIVQSPPPLPPFAEAPSTGRVHRLGPNAAPAAASASLGGRLTARLAGRIGASPGPAMSANAPAKAVPAAAAQTSIATIGTAPWQDRITAPDPRLTAQFLADAAAATAMLQPDLATPLPARRPIASALQDMPARPESAESPPAVMTRSRHRAVLPVPGFAPDGAHASVATPDTQSPRRPIPTAASVRTAMRPDSARAVAGPAADVAARRGFDAVDFADHLRAALVDDARRHGIDVS
jgi:hypothetical protein